MKYLFVLILTVLTVYSVAQEPKTKYPFFIGVETGFSMTESKSYSDKMLQDQYGLTLDFFFSNNRSFKTKIKYLKAERSADISEYDQVFYGSANYEVLYKSDYLIIPALYKWQFGKGETKGFVHGGLFIGIEINPEYQNYPRNFSKSPGDFGVNFGAGVQFPVINNIYFTGELEAYKGFFNKVPDLNTEVILGETLTHFVFSLGFSYKFQALDRLK